MTRSDIRSDLADAVGNTPLIRLRAASEATGCEILGKAEFMNPGQSVKDRAALFMIKDAIARGDLQPDGTIVEGTAGNTGIGLALVGASMGFKTVIVIPETQSQEKKDILRISGAELKEAFEGVNMLWGSLELTPSLSLEALYLLEHKEIIPDPVGTYFSTNDIGTPGGSYVMLGFGIPDQPRINPDLFTEG